MSTEYFAPLMFGGLVVQLLIGFPVAFSLAALGLLFGFIAIELGFFDRCLPAGNLPRTCFGIVCPTTCCWRFPSSPSWARSSRRCGLAEDMLDSMGQLFGPIRGGLGYSVIIVGFILGAITGTVAAQVIAMALISMPVMMRYGYNMRYTTGVLAASGTITQLVPPSLVLIVLADQLGKSVGDMYLGAWGPSVLQIAAVRRLHLRCSASSSPITCRRCRRRAHAAGLAAVAQVPDGHHPLGRADLRGAGHHDAGLATPTEAGAMGAIGAIVLAVIHTRIEHGQSPDRPSPWHRRHDRMLWRRRCSSSLRVVYLACLVCLEAVRIPNCAT